MFIAVSAFLTAKFVSRFVSLGSSQNAIGVSRQSQSFSVADIDEVQFASICVFSSSLNFTDARCFLHFRSIRVQWRNVTGVFQRAADFSLVTDGRSRHDSLITVDKSAAANTGGC